MNIPTPSANLDYLVECKSLFRVFPPRDGRLTDWLTVRRVNWIRARSRMERWTEEVLLLESEMQWYVNFMTSQKSRAEAWAQLDLGDGHKAYALREADEWRRYGIEGASTFENPESEVTSEEADAVIDYNQNEPLE